MLIILNFRKVNPMLLKDRRHTIGYRFLLNYSETLNKEYIERIHQMSYSSLSDNGMLQILSFLIK